MTTPGGYSAGTIFLQVVPSFRNFHQALRKEAKVANKAWADAQDRARKEEADRDKAAAERRGRETGSAYNRALKQAIREAKESLPDIEVNVASTEAEKKIAELKKELASLDGKEIRVGAETRQAADDIKGIRDRLAELTMQETDVEVVANTGRATAEIDKFMRKFGSVERARATAEIDVDTANAERKLERFKRQLQSIDRNGQAMRAFSGITLGLAVGLPLLAPAATAAAGAIAAIAPAAVAGAAGLGVLIVGFTGLTDAVKALQDVHKNAAKDALANAKAQRTAAKGVRDAAQGLANAREQAARSAEDSARRVKDAQENEAQVAETNARRMRDALDKQKKAERDLTDAQDDAKRAQKDLQQARQDAQDQLEDLALRVKGGALAERQAVIDLFEAQVAYNNARQDGAATNLDRENAAIALEQARLRLEQQRLENGRLAEEQAKAKKTGVDGTDPVVAAQQKVEDANRKVADSQQAVKDASADVAQVQKDNARATADAAKATADAMRDQARAAEDSARSIRDAQERVADAQAQYAEAMAKTTASADKLRDAMSKLGPEGQRFARFIYGSVLPALKVMRSEIQAGMLPGVQDMLTKLMGTYGPQFTAFLGTMGRVWGDIFRQMGALFTSPVWQHFFDTMGKYIPIFTQQWADLALNLTTIFAQMTDAFAPLGKDFMQFLVDVTKRFSDFLASANGQQKMQDFMAFVREVGPEVADFFGALWRALLNLGEAIMPYARVMLDFFTGFLNWIAGMNPVTLGLLTASILGLIIVVQILLGVTALMSTLVQAGLIATGSTVIGVVAGIVLAILALVAIFVIAYTKSETFRDIVNGAFKGVGIFLKWVWLYLIKPILVALWETLKFIGQVVIAVADLIWKSIQLGARKLGEVWQAFIKSDAGQALIHFIDKYVEPAWRAAVAGLQAIWDYIKDIFKTGVFFVVETVINDGLIDSFNWLADKVGSKKIPRIDLPASFGLQDGEKAAPRQTSKPRASGVAAKLANQYATGGHVAGFSPSDTADNIPAWLTAGEYVLPVGAVRRLRRTYGDQFLEQLRQGGPAFAKGGLVDFGHMLQKKGFRVTEHPAFGGVHPVHTKGSKHYSGQAIDVNFGPGGESDVEKKAIDGIVGLAKDYGLRVIWRAAGHYNHAHFDTSAGGSILGAIGSALGGIWGSIKDAAGKVVGAPLDYLKGKLQDAAGSLGKSPFGSLLLGAAGKAAEGLANLLLGTSVGDEKDAASAPDGSVKSIVQNAAAGYGWGDGAAWNALQWIIGHENNAWSPTASNPKSTAFGLFQFLDSTWGSVGFTKTTDPALQAAAGMKYIQQRYGDPLKAKQFWEAHGWYSEGGPVQAPGDAPTLYDTGGWLQPGLTTVLNATGKPEPVFTSEQWDLIARGGSPAGGGTTIEINTQTTSTASEIAREVLFANRQMRRGGVYGTRKAP